MEINITLLLQMLQFGCAYYFLYRFLFIPAYEKLDEQEQSKRFLYKNLEQEQHIKDVLLQDLHLKNKIFKDALVQTIPEKATQPIYQKSNYPQIAPFVDKAEFLQQDKTVIEELLINHLSQVVKK